MDNYEIRKFPDKFIVVDKATGESETLELERLEERYIDYHHLVGDYLSNE